MRGSIKVKDKWQLITLSDDPDILIQWLIAHDGKEAVCIDDKKQIYYCATEALRDQYKKGGKTALMFYDLGKKLHKQASAFDPSKDNPYWCATYSLACTNREECREDCCYQPRGGM